jgi:cytochrome c553
VCVSGKRIAWLAGLGLVALGSFGPAVAGDRSANAPTIALNGLPPMVPACSGCHGVSGEGNVAAGFPRLAGLGDAYLVAQLDSFASEKRPNPVMGPIAKALSNPQRKSMASYYASLPSQFARVAVDKAAIRPENAGAWLANRGRWSDGVPACIGCHGNGGAGVPPTFPPLAGQSAAYLATQLNDWKIGKREPGPQALMVLIAGNLKDADIKVVSDYFASLQPLSESASASNRKKQRASP